MDSTLVEWFASANSGELDESMNENDLQNEFLRLALLLAKKQLFSSGGGWLWKEQRFFEARTPIALD